MKEVRILYEASPDIFHYLGPLIKRARRNMELLGIDLEISPCEAHETLEKLRERAYGYLFIHLGNAVEECRFPTKDLPTRVCLRAREAKKRHPWMVTVAESAMCGAGSKEIEAYFDEYLPPFYIHNSNTLENLLKKYGDIPKEDAVH